MFVSLNGLLPHDIRIVNIETVPDDFHARYSAIGKTYHYHLHLDRIINPFKRFYSTHVLHEVDLSLLKTACTFFIGTHDFTSFANEAKKGSASRNPIKHSKRLDLIEEPGGIRLEFEGHGFLYKMVRNIVGTLLDVCSHRFTIEEISEMFEAKDRRRAGKTAPPEGLFFDERTLLTSIELENSKVHLMGNSFYGSKMNVISKTDSV